MSSEKLKQQLKSKLARQQQAVKDCQEQLDWIEQQERKAPKEGKPS